MIGRRLLDLLRFDLLDRHVARTFLASLGVVFLFFFGFFIVIDLFANAGEFVETAQKLSIGARTMAGWVAGLYLYKSPAIFLQVAPFVTVIGAVVAVARLNRQNELVPVLMSGRSIFRLLRPVFVLAAVLTAMMLLVQEHVAPAAADQRLARACFLKDRRDTLLLKHAQFEDAAGRHWSSLELEPISGRLVRAEVRRVSGEAYEIIDLADATFDAARGGWTMAGGIPALIEEGGARHELRLELLESDLTPARIAAREKEPFDLSFADLGHLFAVTGEPRFEVLLHFHVTFPLANLLLLLLALPFVLRYDRQKVMQGFAVAFFLCLAYFGVDAALRTFGETRLHPILAAWFAPLFFGALGISLFDGVRT